MTIIKTQDLTGPALDWAVATIEEDIIFIGAQPWAPDKNLETRRPFHPSTDWAQGGPIIERMNFQIICVLSEYLGKYWDVTTPDGEHEETGDSLLEATMRCYVASKLGEEIEVPDELI